MKAHALILSMFLLALAMAGCREITVTTQVNKDGSFTRIMRITGDSSEVFGADLPYPVDSTWTRKVQTDTGKKGGFIVTYTRYFNNSRELDHEIRSDTGWMRGIDREIHVSKRFGLFYSYLRYRTVYHASNPYRALDYRKYVSPDDLLWLARRKPVTSSADSSRIKHAEERVMEYLEASATAEAEQVIERAVRRLNDPALTVQEVMKVHDSLAGAISKWDFTSSGDLVRYYRAWTGNPAFDKLLGQTPAVFGHFLEQGHFLESLIALQDFREAAELPGIITGTNSLMLKGNLVSWDVSPMAFLLEDYVMEAESRVINIWGFILSGIVLLSLATVLAVRIIRK